jgi:hypothetical protein
MITDWRMAEALVIQARYGTNAAKWVSVCRGALMLAGDIEGVERFGEIARKLEDLLFAEKRPC